jgi:calcineurin-like phosphoesterase family protein
MTTFFTSDHHFSHSNIIKYCNRPFSDVEEMNRILIENWNSVVKTNDTVYHLGDFGFTQRAKAEDFERLQKLCGRLRGKIILIKGNHDTNIDKIKRFETVKDYHVIHTHNTRFVLFHYPMRSWQFANRGSIHLFGHCHSNMPNHYKSFDIGIDNVARNILGDGTLEGLKKENYRPLGVYEVIDYARTLKAPEWAI